MALIIHEVSVADVVDNLGALKSQQADLTTKADGLKAEIIAAAVGANVASFDGQLFRATVTFANKTVVDYKAVIEALVTLGEFPHEIVDQIIATHTKVAEGVPTVRVSARKEG
jgi:hypothetical protein